MEKHAWDGPKWGREDCFPTIPDLADILGRTDLDSENVFFWIPTFWISRSPDFQNQVRAGLGPGRASLEPYGPKNVDFPLYILVFELVTACFF